MCNVVPAMNDYMFCPNLAPILQGRDEDPNDQVQAAQIATALEQCEHYPMQAGRTCVRCGRRRPGLLGAL